MQHISHHLVIRWTTVEESQKHQKQLGAQKSQNKTKQNKTKQNKTNKQTRKHQKSARFFERAKNLKTLEILKNIKKSMRWETEW